MGLEGVRTFRGTEREGSKTHTQRDVELVTPALEALQTMKAFTFLKGFDADVFERPGFRPRKGSKGGEPSEPRPWRNEVSSATATGRRRCAAWASVPGGATPPGTLTRRPC